MSPILYLHGFSGGLWEAEALKKRWMLPVHGVAMPGHSGQQEDERFDFDEAVARVVQSAEKVDGAVNLVGYSMGARVGLAAILRAPELFQKAVLVGVRPGVEETQERSQRVALDESRARRLEDLGVEEFMDWWEELPVIASQAGISAEVREEMRRVRRSHWGPGLAASLREMGPGVMPSLWSKLAALAVPTLLVTGESDLVFKAIAQKMVQYAPCLHHASISDAGHCAHWEQPELFQKLLLGFLEPSL